MCYEEGGSYNLGSRRYQQWLKVNHPTSLFDSQVSEYYKPMQKHSSIHHFLNSPTIPQRSCVTTRNGSVRVLTSAENLKHIDEREKEKQRKILKKEERARSREAKQLQKRQLSQASRPFQHLFRKGFFDLYSNSQLHAWIPRQPNTANCLTSVLVHDENIDKWSKTLQRVHSCSSLLHPSAFFEPRAHQ